jgi:hypothetical protein
MLAKDGNGTTNFENGNENGWPARKKEKKQRIRRLEQEKTTFKNTLTMQLEM